VGVRALFRGAPSGGVPSSSVEVAPPSQALTSTRTCEGWQLAEGCSKRRESASPNPDPHPELEPEPESNPNPSPNPNPNPNPSPNPNPNPSPNQLEYGELLAHLQLAAEQRLRLGGRRGAALNVHVARHQLEAELAYD
jgi:hypothetical protein